MSPGEAGATRLVAGALVRRALDGGAPLAVPHLAVRRGAAEPRLVPLPPELTVGRGPEAGLALDDPAASRRHLSLRLGADGAAEVEDLGSKNGARLNGRRLRRGPAPLRHGDVLTVGSTELRYLDPLAGPGAGAPRPRARDLVRPGEALAARALLGAAGLLGLAALALALG